MSTDRAADLRKALRLQQQKNPDHWSYLLAVVWLRLALAEENGTGVRLSSEEVEALMTLDTASQAAEEIASDLLGHYPGEPDDALTP